MPILKSQFYSKQRYTGHITNIMTFIKNVMDLKNNQNVISKKKKKNVIQILLVKTINVGIRFQCMLLFTDNPSPQ